MKKYKYCIDEGQCYHQSENEYYYNYQGIRYKKKVSHSIRYGNNEEKIYEYFKIYYLDGNRIIKEEWRNPENQITNEIMYYYDIEGLVGIEYQGKKYNIVKDILGNVSKIMYKNRIIGEYEYDGWGKCVEKELSPEKNTEIDTFVLHNNPFRYRGYYYDVETGLFYCNSRYYNPEWGRFLQVADIGLLNPSSINGLNLYAYANNNPISFSYNNSSAGGSASVGGGLVSSIGTSGSSVGNINSSSTSKGGLNLGWLANGLDTGSTIHGLYTSISGLVNHTAYFAKNLAPFADDMKMLGASMKDGVLAFNQFKWGLGKADVFGVVLGVGLDIYDSVQRGVSPGGIALGAALTAAKGVGLIYLNKGIMNGATAIGSCFGPVGTVVGFVVGGAICIVVDIFASNWLDDLIDKIAK